MRVCFIAVALSGSFTFASRLCEELRQQYHVDGYIITNASANNASANIAYEKTGCKVVSVWRKNNIFAPFAILRFARTVGCDALVVQYEYSMFGSPVLTQILVLLLALLSKFFKFKIIIALHGVLSPDSLKAITIHLFIKTLAKIVLGVFYKSISMLYDAIVVLNPLQKEVLEAYGVRPAKINVIPHGVEKCDVGVDGFSEGRQILFHGFVRPSKGLLELIDAVKHLAENNVDVKLKILGSVAHQTFERVDEKRYVMEVTKRCEELKERCIMKLGFHTTEELLKEAKRSYIIVLPYKDRFIESSGVLHTFMDCGKAVIVSATPRFLADLSPSEALFVNPTPEDLYKAIKSLIENEELYKLLAQGLKRKASSRYWNIVAQEWFKVIMK
jgi:glycosyltransferase involved in cell wall biosynthesis